MNSALHLERSPVTGKIQFAGERKEPINPNDSLHLLFADGAEIWEALSPEEQDAVKSLTYLRWVEAKVGKQRTSMAFFGNLLIRMHTEQSPVHGEYTS